MSQGTPGYDFGVNENVSAEKLRRWIERAAWTDLSYSETTGELVGMRVQAAQPSDTSEGLLWYQPAAQKMRVYTRRGWVGVLEPMAWETLRFRSATSVGSARPRRIEVKADVNTSVTAGTVEFQFGTNVAGRGCFVDANVSGETSVDNAYYPLYGWGLCAVASDVPLAAIVGANNYPIKCNAVGQINTPISEASAATNALDLNAIGIALDVTLTPALYAYYPLFFLGGIVMHLHRSDGL